MAELPEFNITIQRTKDGQIKVSGNVLGDRILAYGLLESARDAIKLGIDGAAAPSSLVTAQVVPPSILGGF